MDPIIFHASVKGFTSDEIGECKLTFKIPDCDKAQAHQIGGLTGEVLVVTVMKERDVKNHVMLKGAHHVPTTQPATRARKSQSHKRTR